MKNLKKLLKLAEVVSLYDYSNYEKKHSRNGGKYGFQTVLTSLDNGLWAITYYTTADMDFCTLCGSFTTEEHNCERQYVSTDEVAEAIDEFITSNKYSLNTSVVIDGELIWEGSEREEEEEEEIELENIYMDEEGKK